MVAAAIRARWQIDRRFSADSLGYYLSAVVINSQPDPKTFGAVAEPWQRELIKPKIPAVEYLAGLNPGYYDARANTGGALNFLSVLPRGHDKSSLEGRLATWLLLSARRRIEGYILAADRDQGRLILRAMEDEARLNPWVWDQLTFTRGEVTGPGGRIEVLPADAASSMGLRGNLYIADEFTHWKRQAEWTAMVSGREKVPGSLLIVITNAGLLGSWQHEVREAVVRDPDWVVFEREGQLASWMSRERVDKMRRLLPPSEAARLLDNRWIDPGEEFDYLSRPDTAVCEELGKALGLFYRMRRQALGTRHYVASIDYGPKRDRTVLCVQHLDENRIIRIDRMDVWKGADFETGRVSIEDVEAWITDVEANFAPRHWVVDPANMEATLQWMEKRGLPVERFASRGGAANYEMAQLLRTLVVNGQLAWYPGCGDVMVEDRHTPGVFKRETLADELVGLRVRKMPYGYRFDHENQKHDDRAVAITMGALRAIDYPPDGLTAVKPPSRQAVRDPRDREPGEGRDG